jgi:hypothetical protein
MKKLKKTHFSSDLAERQGGILLVCSVEPHQEDDLADGEGGTSLVCSVEPHEEDDLADGEGGTYLFAPQSHVRKTTLLMEREALTCLLRRAT